MIAKLLGSILTGELVYGIDGVTWAGQGATRQCQRVATTS